MFPWADSTLISTPTAMPYTRSIAFTLNGLRILNFSLSTSVRNASYINLGHNSHKFDINIVSPHPKLSSAFQSCEATVGISVDGKLLVDISPPGETFWGVDGLWTLKRPGIIGAFGAAYQFVTGHQVFAPPEPKISIPEAYVELFGPPKALSDDNPPELQISVKTGTKGEWCVSHASYHEGLEGRVGERNDFHLVVWLVTGSGEAWCKHAEAK